MGEYLVSSIAFGIVDKVLDAPQGSIHQAELVEGMTYYPMYYNTGLYSHVLSQSISSNISSVSAYSRDHSYSGSNSGGFGGFCGGSSSGGSGKWRRRKWLLISQRPGLVPVFSLSNLQKFLALYLGFQFHK